MAASKRMAKARRNQKLKKYDFECTRLPQVARSPNVCAREDNPHPKPRTMTIQQVLQFKAAEKAAKDAFYAQHAAEAKPGSKPSAKYGKLQAAMIAATRARQSAMTAYVAAL